MDILIDIIKEQFTQYVLSRLNEKSPLPIIILNALYDSLCEQFRKQDILKWNK